MIGASGNCLIYSCCCIYIQNTQLTYIFVFIYLINIQNNHTIINRSYQKLIPLYNELRPILIQHNKIQLTPDSIMQQYTQYLTTIKKLCADLRQNLLQNGYSSRQIDDYINSILTVCCDPSQKYISNEGQILISDIIKENNSCLQEIFIRVIRKLEEGLRCDSQLMDVAQQEVAKQQNGILDTKQQNRSRKCSIYLPKDEKQISYQHQVVQTPKKNINLSEYYEKMTSQIKNYDVIEQSIKETLQKTRKLRKYLQYKTKLDSQGKYGQRNQLQQFQQIY